jgi:DNA mismatch repair ATPase MutS
LTALAAKLPRLFNATMRVKEWQGEVVFLHEVVAGAADRSYGVQVAKLAGLPAAVIERAKVVLAELEAEDRTSPARKLIDDLPLFSAAAGPSRRRPARTKRSPLSSTRSRHSTPTTSRRARRSKRFIGSSSRRRSGRGDRRIFFRTKLAPDLTLGARVGNFHI